MIRILILLCSMTAFAGVSESNAEKEVLTAMNAWKQAMIARDRATLEKLFAPGLSYTHSSGKHETKAEAIETAIKGKDRIESLELSETAVSIYGTTALVQAKIIMRMTSGEAVNTLQLDVLHVWMKNGSRWQMIARHAARLNP
jgi:ketosteroid isomerase-like protein